MIKKLEDKYGVIIEDDSYYNSAGRWCKRYRVYSADGCQWDNNLTWKNLLKMLKTDKDDLLKIKEIVKSKTIKHC